MSMFLDDAGRSWSLRATVGTLDTVRRSVGLDLVNSLSAGIRQLDADPVLLCRALWSLCHKQAHAIATAWADFAANLTGDRLERASQKLVEELLHFFPSRRRCLPTPMNARSRKSMLICGT